MVRSPNKTSYTELLRQAKAKVSSQFGGSQKQESLIISNGLEAVQGRLAAGSAELKAAMRLGEKMWEQTPDPGVRKQIEDKLSELQATRVATEQRRRHAVRRIDEVRWDLLQERMWMEESFEERYPELPIRYVHDGPCVLDRDLGRRPLNEPFAFGLHEANLPLQPTAASHSFRRPHLLQAEMGMDGDCVHTAFVEQHPAHWQIERAHYLHELPHEHTVFAARPPAHWQIERAVLVRHHPAPEQAECSAKRRRCSDGGGDGDLGNDERLKPTHPQPTGVSECLCPASHRREYYSDDFAGGGGC